MNQLYRDDLGKISGIFLIDKPVGITSHDVVDSVRRVLKTKQVGHAGTLDPFASGLLIILVGKATKKSDEFMGFDKSYLAEVAFGVSTDSHDPEGKVEEVIENYVIDEKLLNAATGSFVGKYNQAVPVYSSVKVNGDKLRELARKYESFSLEDMEDNQRIVFKSENSSKEVLVPKRTINIYEMDVKEIQKTEFTIRGESYSTQSANIDISCGKGTYIRQLAYDLGKQMGVPAMLINLRRTRIGSYNVTDSLPLHELSSYISQAPQGK